MIEELDSAYSCDGNSGSDGRFITTRHSNGDRKECYRVEDNSTRNTREHFR